MYELKLNLAVHGMYGIFVFFQKNVFYNIDSAMVRYWYLKNIWYFCTICTICLRCSKYAVLYVDMNEWEYVSFKD